jgi:peptide/nickel transport system permease protein
MLILTFAVHFRIFPTSTRPIGFAAGLAQLVFQLDPSGLRTWLAHIILPAVTLGTYFTAFITRLTRSGMLDEIGQQYVRAARAKGLPDTLVMYKHALRNTLAPIINILGLQVGTLLGGSVVTEQVFAWPGLGKLLIGSVFARDWPMIQAALILIGTIYVTVNIVVDFMYFYINPRVTEP